MPKPNQTNAKNAKPTTEAPLPKGKSVANPPTEAKASAPVKLKKGGQSKPVEKTFVKPQYKELRAVFHVGPDTPVARGCERADPITAELMKEWLGWEAEPEEGKFGDDYLFTDENDRNIRCHNNSKNRPLDIDLANKYAFEVLNRNWAGSINMPGLTINGETLVFAEDGETASGQHRGIGLVLAKQMWEKGVTYKNGKQVPHDWKTVWPTEPVMESLVVFGISKDPKVIRTLDNVRERTGSDTMFSTNLFAKFTPEDRKTLCKILDGAVRYLWVRTGQYKNEVTPYRTQSEIMRFVETHPSLLGVVERVWKEDSEGKLSVYVPPAYTAALMYLFGASATDKNAYDTAVPPSEDVADMSRLETAEGFFVDLATASGSTTNRLTNVEKMSFPIEGDTVLTSGHRGRVFHKGVAGGRIGWKIAALCKAWNLYVAEEEITPKALALDWEFDTTTDKRFVAGDAVLKENPSVLGMDEPEDQDDGDGDDGDEGGGEGAPKSRKQMILDMQNEHAKDKLLLFKSGTGPATWYLVWGADVEVFEEILDITRDAKNKGEFPSARFHQDDYVKNVRLLQEAGYSLVVTMPGEEEDVPKYEDVKVAKGTKPGKTPRVPQREEPEEEEAEEEAEEDTEDEETEDEDTDGEEDTDSEEEDSEAEEEAEEE